MPNLEAIGLVTHLRSADCWVIALRGLLVLSVCYNSLRLRYTETFAKHPAKQPKRHPQCRRLSFTISLDSLCGLLQKRWLIVDWKEFPPVQGECDSIPVGKLIEEKLILEDTSKLFKTLESKAISRQFEAFRGNKSR